MQTLGDPRAHYWRVIGMSHACDVDLQTALDEGRLSHEAYADMITQCRGCTKVGQCDRALADGAKRDAAPDYCVNHDIFAQLQPAAKA